MRSTPFPYVPGEHETERASNSYLMSLIAIIAGLPLPIINLLATLIFFLGNRKGSYFVRWHCTQALLSQLSLLPLNSIGFWWTVSIAFGEKTIDGTFLAYILTLVFFNIIEFIVTIYTAIETRKGRHIEWWFYGPLTNVFVRP